MSGDLKNFEEYRYRYDQAERYGISLRQDEGLAAESRVKKSLLAEAIRVEPGLMPVVARKREQVQERLSLQGTLEMYVQPNSEYQAYCVSVKSKELGKTVPTVILTSGLINILEDNEIAFVMGHELGHYIFGHHSYPSPLNAKNGIAKLNMLELSRSAEISADRIGLLASDSLEAAIRAMLKVSTGLDARHLRFDISSILDQLRELASLGGYEGLIGSSHPMFPVRMKGLLWFQMSDEYRERIHDGHSSMPLSKVDEKVYSDLNRISGFAIQDARRDSFEIAKLWTLVKLAAADNKLSKQEQSLLKRHFGEQNAGKAILFLQEHGADGLDAKFEEALARIASHPVEDRETFVAEIQRMGEGWSIEDPAINKVFRLINNRLRLTQAKALGSSL